jgi:hypothetical protein
MDEKNQESLNVNEQQQSTPPEQPQEQPSQNTYVQSEPMQNSYVQPQQEQNQYVQQPQTGADSYVQPQPEANQYIQSSVTSTKKPIFKKWWFWLIIVVVVGVAINTLLPENDNKMDNKDIEMANVLGMSLSDAIKQLENKGFTSVEYIADNDETILSLSDWFVTAQNVNAGDTVKADTAVSLTATAKKSENATPPVKDEPIEDETVDVPTDENDTNQASSNTSWKQFLKEYEAWIDSYIAIMKKYEANPTDLSLLADIAEFAEETTEWAAKAEDIEDDLSGDDLAAYLETYSRIIQKLSSIL